jgi:ketosteroid isomerase-like protein
MRTRALAGIIVFAAAVGLASVAAAEDAGAKSVDAAWVKGMKSNDLDAIVACYAKDAVMWFPGAPEARGTAAIRAIYAGYLAEFNVSDAVLSNTTYQTSGDLSAAWGDFVLTLAPKKGGAPEVLKGRFTSVSKKVGGKWAYVADQASATPPPPPPAAK